MTGLEQYKKGEMNKEELENFTGKFLRAKYDEDRKNKWRQILTGQHKLDRNETTQSLQISSKRVYLWVAATAAAVAVALFMLIPGASAISTYEQLADAYLTEDFYENRGNNSRGEQDVEQLNLQAIIAYNQKDFETAIGHYEMIIDRGQANDEHLFFLGLSYLYVEQFTAAIVNLLKVSELNVNSRFQQETQWFLALAYLKNRDLENGKTVLMSIASDMWNYQKAQELLKVIDR